MQRAPECHEQAQPRDAQAREGNERPGFHHRLLDATTPRRGQERGAPESVPTSRRGQARHGLSRRVAARSLQRHPQGSTPAHRRPGRFARSGASFLDVCRRSRIHVRASPSDAGGHVSLMRTGTPESELTPQCRATSCCARFARNPATQAAWHSRCMSATDAASFQRALRREDFMASIDSTQSVPLTRVQQHAHVVRLRVLGWGGWHAHGTVTPADAPAAASAPEASDGDALIPPDPSDDPAAHVDRAWLPEVLAANFRLCRWARVGPGAVHRDERRRAPRREPLLSRRRGAGRRALARRVRR